MGQRDYRIDNIRWVLILLVVFGHLIETLSGAPVVFLYTVIYTFHMPAFVFITGYFARFKLRRIGLLALTYLAFQTLYLLVDWGLAGGANGALELQYFTPDWIMWYLLATLVWTLAVPLLKTESRSRMGLAVAISAAIALAVGFVDGIGYFLSLSRILVFAPFFIAGYYVHQLASEQAAATSAGEGCGAGAKSAAAAGARNALLTGRWPMRRILLVVGIIGVIATCIVAASGAVRPSSLYNSMSYGRTDSNIGIRLGMMVLAVCWICLMFAVIPNRKLPGISYAGSHSMPIYILHGFVVRVLRTFVVMPFGEIGNIVCALVLAIALVFAFGNRLFDKIVRFGI